MSKETTLTNAEYANLQLTAQIVSAWTANNSARQEELLETIHLVHKALSGLQNSGLDMKAEEVATVEAPKAFVSVKKSVTDDKITCLCCGKTFKSIKRHIRTSHGFTPDEYRANFSLPNDYPMVAPGYAKERSEIAFNIGLGRKPAE